MTARSAGERPQRLYSYAEWDRYGVKCFGSSGSRTRAFSTEIRRQSDGDDFELVITREDGREQIEKFADARAVVERSQLLHDSLLASGWRPPETAGTSRVIGTPSRIALPRSSETDA